jgi:hypothetical protein
MFFTGAPAGVCYLNNQDMLSENLKRIQRFFGGIDAVDNRVDKKRLQRSSF